MDYSTKEDIVEDFFEKIKSLIIPSESNNYKSRFLQSNLLLYCVVLLLVLKIVVTLISINIPNNIFFADITKSSLENFVNQTRQSVGLQALSENEKLNQAAQLKAENMVQNQYFDHTSPSGVTPWFWFTQAGYSYRYAGENLAIGFYDSEEVYNAWLNSPSHKANIVNPNYTEVGTAVLKGFGQNNSIIVVQEFASPQPVKNVVAKINNTKTPVTIKPKTTVTPKAIVPEAIAPVPAASTQSATITNERVLSQTTESQSIKPVSGKVANNLSSRLLNYVIYNYNGLLQNIIYGISLVLIGVLLTLIFFNLNVNFKRELVFRTVLIMVLLSVATMVNKEIIISFIPHQMMI